MKSETKATQPEFGDISQRSFLLHANLNSTWKFISLSRVHFKLYVWGWKWGLDVESVHSKV